MSVVWETKEARTNAGLKSEGGHRPDRASERANQGRFQTLSIQLPGGDNADSPTGEASFANRNQGSRFGFMFPDISGRHLSSNGGRLQRLTDVVQSVQRKGLKITGKMTISERWRGNAARIVYSPKFRYYYVLMICINLFALAYSFHDPEGAPQLMWFLTLEAFITLALIAEVILRILAEGLYPFCHSCSNVFDAIVAIMCLASLAMFIVTPALTEYFEEDIAFLLRCIRDTVRLMRLVFLCKNTRQSQITHALAPVTMRMAAMEEREALMDDSILLSPTRPGSHMQMMLDDSPSGLSLELCSPTLTSTLSDIDIAPVIEESPDQQDEEAAIAPAASETGGRAS